MLIFYAISVVICISVLATSDLRDMPQVPNALRLAMNSLVIKFPRRAQWLMVSNPYPTVLLKSLIKVTYFQIAIIMTQFLSIVKFSIARIQMTYFLYTLISVACKKISINLHFTFRNFIKLPDVIAITEIKLQNDTIYNNIDIAGYNFIHADSLKKAGGVGFYIKNSLLYTVKPKYDLNLNFVENIWTQVNTDKNSVLVGVIYRHSVNIVNQPELFSRTIEEKFCNLSNNKSEFYILGNFNIDLLQVTNNRVIKSYANKLVG